MTADSSQSRIRKPHGRRHIIVVALAALIVLGIIAAVAYAGMWAPIHSANAPVSISASKKFTRAQLDNLANQVKKVAPFAPSWVNSVTYDEQSSDEQVAAALEDAKQPERHTGVGMYVAEHHIDAAHLIFITTSITLTPDAGGEGVHSGWTQTYALSQDGNTWTLIDQGEG